MLETNLPSDGAQELPDGGVIDVVAELPRDAAVTVEVMVEGQKVALQLDAYLPGGTGGGDARVVSGGGAESAGRGGAQLHPVPHGESAGGRRARRRPAVRRPGALQGVPGRQRAGDGRRAVRRKQRDVSEKIRAAVRDTDGVVLTYNGDPAMAAFHAISGGMTESAEDVWGQAAPYLVEVESPGEEDAVKFSETVEFDRASLRETLLAAYPDASLGDDPAAWLTDVARSPAGMIKSASLGGVTVGGMELRMLLGLNSADFSLEADGDTVRITTTGYGHGVG